MAPSFTSSQFDGGRAEQIFNPTFDGCIFRCHLDLVRESMFPANKQTAGQLKPFAIQSQSVINKTIRV